MPPSQPAHSMVVVDDDHDYRLLVSLAVGSHPLLEIVGEAGTTAAAVELAGRLEPDLVLLDLGMSSAAGRSALAQVWDASPSSCVIATSSSPEYDHGLCVPTGRVLGHISKATPPGALVAEILSLVTLIDAVDIVLEVAAIRLPSEPSSAASARRFVEQTLSRWRCEELVDTVKLLVSELAGNAIGHAHSEVEVIVRLLSDRLRVEVADDSPEGLRRRQTGADSVTGRGIEVVEAMADSWGVSPHRGGKKVWFELSRPGGPEPTGNNGAKATAGRSLRHDDV